MKMNLETIDKKEVYFATTNQYKIKFEDGTVMEFRVAEDLNGTEFYVLTDSEWTTLEDGNTFHDAFFEFYSEGSLE